MKSALITPQKPWRMVDVHTSIDSTNLEALRAPRPWRVVVADHQSAGRGRLSRRWEAPPGASVAVSCVVPMPVDRTADLGWLPLVAGMAMRQALADVADVLQIGARNMQNFVLLKAVAKCGKPVMLKRGPSATLEEWMMAAEYILDGGNDQVMFCERGIRTFESYTRNTLDLSMVPALHALSHLPVIVDPSHGTGKWQLVHPMAKAALAAGADGLIVEVHPHPEKAVSDGKQSLTPEKFQIMMTDLARLTTALDRQLGEVSL